MPATIESIALKIDTPTGEITPGRGFYQLEEDALYVQVGAGIVADSSPPREYEECMNKGRALLAALAIAHKGVG